MRKQIGVVLIVVLLAGFALPQPAAAADVAGLVALIGMAVVFIAPLVVLVVHQRAMAPRGQATIPPAEETAVAAVAPAAQEQILEPEFPRTSHALPGRDVAREPVFGN